MAGKRQYTAKEMCEAIRKHHGNLLQASKELDCSPATIYSYRDQYKTVAQTIKDERSKTYEEVSQSMEEIAQDDDHPKQSWAIERIQETYGENLEDGLDWTEKQRKEIQGEGDYSVNIESPDEEEEDEN